ncbi:MAG: RimK/LysX family protein [Gammaproteobacteria bacterium]|jgi:hypothetical protein
MSTNYHKFPVLYPITAHRGAGVLVLLFGFFILPLDAAADTRVIGWIEKVKLDDGLIITAKIDTGARHSSLNVKDHKLFRKKGESWIRFPVTGTNGKTVTIERQIIRYADVKRKGYRAQRRPVVQMAYCLADVSKMVEVNLVDRTQFKYPMLVGRSFLRDDFVVDPSITFTIDPTCRKKP